MKKYSKKIVTVISAVLCLTICLVTGFIVSGIDEEKPTVIEIRLKDDHPGIPGYDVKLAAMVYYGVEGSKDRISKEDYTISCDVEEVIIDGDMITIPASFKDTTDLEGFNIYVKHNTDDTVIASYPYVIKKWEKTKGDDFDGASVDTNLWKVSDSTGTEDVGYGRSKGYDKNAVYIAEDTANDGTKTKSMVLDYKVNDKTGTNKDATYITGCVDSKYSQVEGLFTASIKMPTEGGALNAFWTIPTTETWGKAWFATVRSGEREGMLMGENDIVEYSPNWKDASGVPKCQITDHFWYSDTLKVDSAKQHHVSYSSQNLKGKYVEFSMAWTPVGYYYYVDGELVRTVKNIESTDEPATLRFQILGSDFIESADGKPDEGRSSWAGTFTHDNVVNGTMKMLVDYCYWYK